MGCIASNREKVGKGEGTILNSKSFTCEIASSLPWPARKHPPFFLLLFRCLLFTYREKPQILNTTLKTP